MFHAGKVQYVLVSGGNLPWTRVVRPEADFVAGILEELGVPRTAIVTETKSVTTRENAVNVSAILQGRGWKTALLVTSGAHMPRAMAAFRRVGIDAVAAPTDIGATVPSLDTALDILPQGGALSASTDAIKEWIGILVYRMRGWA